MNVVFWLLVIVALVLVWFLLAFAFRGIGKFWFKIYDDAAIDTVNFTDISVDEETAAAIQKKVTAQQEMELANIEA